MGILVHYTVDDDNARRFTDECARLETTPGAVINDLMARFDADSYLTLVDGHVPQARRRGRRPGTTGPFKTDGSLRRRG